jgi:hypothetical protein
MKAVVQNYIGTTVEWENANPVLYEGVEGIEITNKIDPDGHPIHYYKRGDGKTAWQNLPYIDENSIKGLPEKLAAFEEGVTEVVDGFTQALANETTARQNAVSGEAQAREQGDQALGQDIADEATARQNAVSNEATARENADEALGQAIADEATARQNADQALGQAIADETTARQNAVSGETQARQQAVSGETHAREQAFYEVAQAISQEYRERTGDIDQVTRNINTEAQTRQQEVTALQQNLDTEAQIRQQEDTAFQQGLTTAQQDIVLLKGTVASLHSILRAVGTDADRPDTANPTDPKWGSGGYDATKNYLIHIVHTGDDWELVAGDTVWAIYNDNNDYVRNTRTINGLDLTVDRVLGAADIKIAAGDTLEDKITAIDTAIANIIFERDKVMHDASLIGDGVIENPLGVAGAVFPDFGWDDGGDSNFVWGDESGRSGFEWAA